MSFLTRVARGAEFRSNGMTSGFQNPAAWLTDALVGPRTYSGQRVTPRTAIGLVPLMGAVSLISESVAKLPLKVYRNLDGGNKEEQQEHRAWRMLHDAPNDVMPARRFWATIVLQLLLYGNAFAEKIRSDGMLVDQLWPLDPTTITVKWDGRQKTYIQDLSRGVAGNTFTAGVAEIATVAGSPLNTRTLSTDDVLHFMGISYDGIVGVSRITECRQSLGTAQARNEFEGGFYKRGAVMSGVVEHPGRPTSVEATKNLRESLAGIYGGSSKSHQIGVLWEDSKFRPLSMALRDLQFIESKQLTATEIAVLFNIPPNRLGGLTGDSMTYANVEQNQLQFVMDAVEPWTTNIEETVSNDMAVFPQSSYYAEFEMNALLRTDHAARAAFYKDLATVKAITVNEIRALEGMPPLPGGDLIGSSVPETERVTDTQSASNPTPTPQNGGATPEQQTEVVKQAAQAAQVADSLAK